MLFLSARSGLQQKTDIRSILSSFFRRCVKQKGPYQKGSSAHNADVRGWPLGSQGPVPPQCDPGDESPVSLVAPVFLARGIEVKPQREHLIQHCARGLNMDNDGPH